MSGAFNLCFQVFINGTWIEFTQYFRGAKLCFADFLSTVAYIEINNCVWYQTTFVNAFLGSTPQNFLPLLLTMITLSFVISHYNSVYFSSLIFCFITYFYILLITCSLLFFFFSFLISTGILQVGLLNFLPLFLLPFPTLWGEPPGLSFSSAHRLINSSCFISSVLLDYSFGCLPSQTSWQSWCRASTPFSLSGQQHSSVFS